jgi:hypothetical protein
VSKNIDFIFIEAGVEFVERGSIKSYETPGKAKADFTK